jgi:hypothetical protein
MARSATAPSRPSSAMPFELELELGDGALEAELGDALRARRMDRGAGAEPPHEALRRALRACTSPLGARSGAQRKRPFHRTAIAP